MRPLARAPKAYYLSLAREGATKPIVNGVRPRQRFYFNDAHRKNLGIETLNYIVDGIHCKEAVWNTLWWLMVESGSKKPYTMQEFFRINMQNFEGQDRQQLKVLGGTVDKSMNDACSAPIVKTMKALDQFQSLIPPIIRDHYANIVARGFGYQGFCRKVRSISDAK